MYAIIIICVPHLALILASLMLKATISYGEKDKAVPLWQTTNFSGLLLFLLGRVNKAFLLGMAPSEAF